MIAPLGLLALALSGSTAGNAQVLVQAGDSLPGLGTVQYVGAHDVADDRRWVAVAGLDNARRPEALLRNGRVVALMNEPTSVPGVINGGFGHPRVASTGRLSYPAIAEPAILYLSGAWVDGRLELLGGDPGLAPELPPGLSYRYFASSRVTDQHVVFGCDLDDAAFGTLFHQSLMRVTPQPSGPPGQSVVVQIGDRLPGLSEPVGSIDIGNGDWDLNDAGQVIYTVTTLGDGVSWTYLDRTLLMKTGDPVGNLGPLDRIWTTSLNAAGDWTLRGSIAPLVDVLIHGGDLVVAEGDAPPALGGFVLTSIYGFPTVTDAGTIFWQGRWNDPDTTQDDGLFLDDQLLVREGSTVIEGQTLARLGPATISDDGRVVLFSGSFDPAGSTSDALFRLFVR